MSISIASPSAGNAGNPTLLATTFAVTGSYDGTPNGANPNPNDTDFAIPVGVTLKRFVRAELTTPVGGNSAASEFSDAGDQNWSGNYSITVTLSAGDVRRAKPLTLTPILRKTGVPDEVGQSVSFVQTNA